jgi:hypothetical protein
MGDRALARRRAQGPSGGRETHPSRTFRFANDQVRRKWWKVDLGMTCRVPGQIEQSTSTLRMQIGHLCGQAVLGKVLFGSQISAPPMPVRDHSSPVVRARIAHGRRGGTGVVANEVTAAVALSATAKGRRASRAPARG